MSVTSTALIERAEAVLRPVQRGERWFADVGAAVESAAGNVYVGVAIDMSSRAFCAEQAAIAAMVTAGEYVVRRVVAVWRDSRPGADQTLYVIPPCGVCRQCMEDLAAENLDARVILGADEDAPLRELLPLHGWAANPARSVAKPAE